jgi:Carboxypeptidase regulatory-like domain
VERQLPPSPGRKSGKRQRGGGFGLGPDGLGGGPGLLPHRVLRTGRSRPATGTALGRARGGGSNGRGGSPLRTLALTLALLVVAAALWFAGGTGEPAPLTPAGETHAPALDSALDLADPTRGGRTSEREEQDAPLAPEDPDPLEPAAGNGLLFVLAGPDGQPLADTPITVSWRKGWGGYGEDVGRTDGRGLFRSTVAEPFQVEDVRVTVLPFEFSYPSSEFQPDPDEPGILRIQLPGLGRVIVTALDSGGAACADREVELTRQRGRSLDPYLHVLTHSPLQGRTDDAGRLELVVPLGTWSATLVRSAELEPLGQVLVRLDKGNPVQEVNLRALLLPDGQALEVLVEPLESPGNSPKFWARGQVEGRAVEHRPKAESVGENRFRLPLPAVGSWTLHGRLRGHQPLTRPIPAGAARMRVAFVRTPPPPPAPRLRGVVRSTFDGSPLRAMVELVTWPDSGSGSGTACDEQGRFEVKAWSSRPLYLRASLEGYAWGMVGPIDPELIKGELLINLYPARRIAGRVVNTAGDPVDCFVHLYRSSQQVTPVHNPPDPNRTLLESSVDLVGTGLTGAFDFDGVTGGEQELWVLPRDRLQPPARLRTRGGQEDLVIVLGDGLAGSATLRGACRDALTGEPIDGVRIEFVREDQPVLQRGLSDGAGDFRVRGLTPGAYELRAQLEQGDARTYAFLEVGEIELKPGDNTLDLELLPARQLHLYLLEVDGTPLVDAYLNVLDPQGATVELQDRYGNLDGINASSDANGRADLRGLPAGKVELLVWRSELAEEAGEDPDGRFEIDLTRPLRQLTEVSLSR